MISKPFLVIFALLSLTMTTSAVIQFEPNALREDRRGGEKDTHRPRTYSSQPCQKLLEILCTHVSPTTCRMLRREFAQQKFRRERQRHCQELLDDPKRLDDVIRWLRRF